MKLILRERRHEVEDIWSFDFTGGPAWVAGQSIRLELPVGCDTEERRFTIASAPSDGVMTITTRLGESSFKRALGCLSPGAQVDGYAIEGDFIWHPSDQPPLWLAFGLGITPFRAMIRQAQYEGRSVNAELVYVGRIPLYDMELREVARQEPWFRLRTLRPDEVTAASLAAAVDLTRQPVYLAGPSSVVDLWARQLDAPNTYRDWFTGRSGWDTISSNA